MDKLTEYYPAFEQVVIKKTVGLGCALICEKQGYECKSCPVQEVINELYRREHGKEVPGHER